MEAAASTEVIAIVASVAVSGTGSIFWFLFQSARREAVAAKSASIAVKESCKEDASQIRQELAAYKLHVAEKYVTQEALTKAVTGLEKAVERLLEATEKSATELRSAIEGIHRRIDQKVDK
jgi:hypothetical protein